MSHLSVNINKIATLRNSRGGDVPNLIEFSKIILDAGAHGLTIHPRSDERHIRYSDISDVKKFLDEYNLKNQKKKELNIEGECSERFLKIVLEYKPDQVTFVPVTPGEITSDHGFDLKNDSSQLNEYLLEAKNKNIRTSIFLETEISNLKFLEKVETDRIEFYTGPFAHEFDQSKEIGMKKFQEFQKAAEFISELDQNIGINAGHDLDHENLEIFKKLKGLKEVSIGHRLVVYALKVGMTSAVQKYLHILGSI